MADVFVAVATIDVGEEITLEKIKLEQWPADRMPANSTNDSETLEGKFAKQRIYEGEPILSIKLMDENWTEVPDGYRVVATKASNSGIANLIQPGDRVDVTAFFSAGNLFPKDTTKIVLKGVRVYALDGIKERLPTDERSKQPKDIQLMIHQSEVEAFELAGQMGKLNLLVSNSADTEADQTEAGKIFVAWLNQLQEERQRELDAAAEAKNRRGDRGAQSARNSAKPRKQGFITTKFEGGRMVVYEIVPGKPPVIISESAPEENVDGEPPAADAGSDPNARRAGSPSREAHSYLNGSDSPLYQ